MSLQRSFVIVCVALGVACGAVTGCGGGSSTTATTPPGGSTGTPAEATGLFVNAAPDAGGNTALAAAYVGWVASTGPSITGYLVTYTVNGGTAVTLNEMTNAATITGLPAGGSLSVTVTAQNVAGSSAATVPVVVTLPQSPTTAESTAYASAAAYSDAMGGEAVLVFKNGATVYTHYAAGYADTAHPIASGTKSYSCALEILAEQAGSLTLNTNASGKITEWAASANKSQISVLDLLSLQSGLSGNTGYSNTNVPNIDTYQLAVNETDSYPVGQALIYDPLSFQNFALIFQLSTGGTYQGNGEMTGGSDPVNYLQANLFTPMGITLTSAQWTRDDKGHPQMAGGASPIATDWLKYGQLMLQHGTWQTSRLLDATKLANCTGGYVNPAYGAYGITWWLNAHATYNAAVDVLPPDVQPYPGSNQIAPHVPVDMFMAAGEGKERLYVIPSLGLAVVRLAPVNSTAGNAWVDDTFAGKVVGTVP